MRLLDRLADAAGSILRRVRSSAEATETRDVNPQVTRDFFLPRRLLGDDRLQDPYRDHAWIYAAIGAIWRNIAGLPFLIHEGDRKGSRVIEAGPWNMLFRMPNPTLTQDQLWEAIVVHLMTAGMTIIVKEGPNDARVAPDEIPSELWPLSGLLFEPELDPETRTKLIAWKFTSPEGGKQLVFAPHEVIVLKRLDPMNPFMGLPPLRAAIRAARRDFKAAVFDEAFFDNAAVVGGVIETPPGTSGEQARTLRRQKEDRHASASKAHRMMILQGGMKFIPAQESHRDMQFLEMRGWDRDEILAVFGVPKSEVGLEPSTNIITGAGVLSENRGFWTRTLNPMMRAIEQAFFPQLFLAPSKGTVFGQFDREAVSALQADLTVALAQAAQLKGMGYPANMVNERLDLGMPNVGWGDQPLVPAGTVPLSPEGVPEPAPIAALDEGFFEAPGLSTHEGEDEEKPLTLPDPGLPPSYQSGCRAAPEQPEMTDERKRELNEYWHRVAQKSIFPMEASFQGAWRRHLMELRAHQLNRIRKKKPTTSKAIDKALFSRKKWDKKAKDKTDPVYEKAVDRAEREISEELGVDLKLTKKQRAATIKSQKRVLTIGHRTIKRRLKKSLAEGVKLGETGEQLEDRTREVFNISMRRSRVSSREEVSGVINKTRTMIMEKAGITEHQWIVQSGNPRKTHKAQNGQIVKIGKPFANGLRHPQDQKGKLTGEVCGCQCITKPVIPEGFGEKKRLIVSAGNSGIIYLTNRSLSRRIRA